MVHIQGSNRQFRTGNDVSRTSLAIHYDELENRLGDPELLQSIPSLADPEDPQNSRLPSPATQGRASQNCAYYRRIGNVDLECHCNTNCSGRMGHYIGQRLLIRVRRSRRNNIVLPKIAKSKPGGFATGCCVLALGGFVVAWFVAGPKRAVAVY